MNDDLQLETRLATAFRGGSLPAAPPNLLDALDDIVREPMPRPARNGVRAARGRRWPGVLGLAAVLLLGGALALSIGGPTPLPVPAVPPSNGTSSPAASQPADATRLVFEPQWTAEAPSDTEILAAIVSILEERIESSEAVDGAVIIDASGRLVVEVPAGADPEAARDLLTATGDTQFVPLDGDPPPVGTAMPAGLSPLVVSSDITSAVVGEDHEGLPTLVITLTEQAGASFGAYTAANIGSALAITVDGIVVAAPIITSEIPGGVIQISNAPTDPLDPDAMDRLAAIIGAGPLPVEVLEATEP